MEIADEVVTDVAAIASDGPVTSGQVPVPPRINVHSWPNSVSAWTQQQQQPRKLPLQHPKTVALQRLLQLGCSGADEAKVSLEWHYGSYSITEHPGAPEMAP